MGCTTPDPNPNNNPNPNPNQVHDAGEECDDGNVLSGDGCGAGCSVECGYTCQQLAGRPTAPGVAGASVCALGCGNGVVDHALGETCDVGGVAAEAGLACCVRGTLAPGASCCGGAHCDAHPNPNPSASPQLLTAKPLTPNP